MGKVQSYVGFEDHLPLRKSSKLRPYSYLVQTSVIESNVSLAGGEQPLITDYPAAED